MGATNQPLDELDYAIISQLQYDARRSYTQIAGALNVSVGTIRNRVTRMVNEGIVRFICRLDANRVGFSNPTIIKISIRPSVLIEEAAGEIIKFPEVYYLALVAGEYDLEIDVMCRDQEHLSNLITQRLHKVNGVHATVTSVVLRVYKLSIPDFSLFNAVTKDTYGSVSCLNTNKMPRFILHEKVRASFLGLLTVCILPDNGHKRMIRRSAVRGKNGSV